jgi:hypothetical protein
MEEKIFFHENPVEVRSFDGIRQSDIKIISVLSA